MAVTDWNTNPDLNTLIDAVSIAENCPPGNMNDMGRRIMAAVKTWANTVNAAVVSTRTAMKALSVTAHTSAILTEPGRFGRFRLIAGAAPSDTLEGIYVVSNTAGYYWARDWDKVSGKPEWFGAVTNTSSGGVPAANLTALAACVTLCPIMVLEKADYFISDVWKFTQAVSRRTIKGVAGSIDTQGDATRIILTGSNVATKKVLQVGPDVMPGTLAGNVPYELHFSDIIFMRDGAVTPGGATALDGVRGVSVQGALGCTFRNIKSLESAVGFYITGAVNCHFDDRCQSHRSIEGTTSVNDYYVGWALGGTAANFGYAGANASLYVDNVQVTVDAGATFADSYGLFAFGYIADTFITRFESTGVNKGALIDGYSYTAVGAHANFTFGDVRLDAYGANGIELNNLNATCNVDISKPYVGPLSTADYGLRVYNCNGAVKVSGGTVAAYYTNPTDFIGLALDTSSGTTVDGLALVDCHKPVVVNGCAGYDLKPVIRNPNRTAADVAIAFVGSNSRGRCAPIVRGKVGAFLQAVSYAGTSSNNTATDLTGIDPGCLLSSSATNKLFYNGSAVSTDTFGTGNVRMGAVG